MWCSFVHKDTSINLLMSLMENFSLNAAALNVATLNGFLLRTERPLHTEIISRQTLLTLNLTA